MQGIPKIKKITALDGLMVLAEFENGIKKEYDVNPLLDVYPIFNEL